MLTTDSGGAYSYLYKHSNQSFEITAPEDRTLNDVDHLIVSWIATVEKLRHGITLDKPFRAVFEWLTTPPLYERSTTIKGGQEVFQGMQLFPVERKNMLNEIELYERKSVSREDHNFKPGRIMILRVSEDRSILDRVIEYYSEDFYRTESDLYLNKKYLFDSDKLSRPIIERYFG